eukprot:13098042-Heterocapsa_arctica.AAC.1
MPYRGCVDDVQRVDEKIRFYIGRSGHRRLKLGPSDWGNPHNVSSVGSARRALELYIQDFTQWSDAKSSLAKLAGRPCC